MQGSGRTSGARSRRRARPVRSRGRPARRCRAARGRSRAGLSSVGAIPKRPWSISRSVPQTPTSSTRTSTSPAPTAGAVIVSTRVECGTPGVVTSACTSSPGRRRPRRSRPAGGSARRRRGRAAFARRSRPGHRGSGRPPLRVRSRAGGAPTEGAVEAGGVDPQGAKVGAGAGALGAGAEGGPARARRSSWSMPAILRPVVGAVLILVPAATAVLVALSLRLRGQTSTLVTAYVAWVANLALVTEVLSPLRQVDRGGLAAVEGALLAGAFVWWWRAGRPRPEVRVPAVDPVTALALAAVLVLLGYELLLGLTVPPDNWDAVSYHLARVAAWLHHGGVYWVPNAPTDRINEFQPLAEQQLLYLFVATGSGRLYALPQFLAELALLVCVYGSARRLGYGAAALGVRGVPLRARSGSWPTRRRRPRTTWWPPRSCRRRRSCCSARERGRTSWPASRPGSGSASSSRRSSRGPFSIGLALLRGGRTAGRAALGAAGAFVAVGCWGFVLNLSQTGHVLGHGGGRVGRHDHALVSGLARDAALDPLHDARSLGALAAADRGSGRRRRDRRGGAVSRGAAGARAPRPWFRSSRPASSSLPLRSSPRPHGSSERPCVGRAAATANWASSAA